MDKDEKQEQLIRDYSEIFASIQGQRVLDNLKRLSRSDIVVIPKGNDGHTDVYAVCREEGMRSVIVHIETMLRKGRHNV